MSIQKQYTENLREKKSWTKGGGGGRLVTGIEWLNKQIIRTLQTYFFPTNYLQTQSNIETRKMFKFKIDGKICMKIIQIKNVKKLNFKIRVFF